MKSITHTKSFEIDHPVVEVFPLFTPEGEKKWAPGWDYVNVMGTTKLSEDYVFLTETHDHASTEAIWLVKEYDPDAHFIQYYKIEPQDKIGVVTVDCIQLQAGKTKVKVTYKYMAISATGEQFLSEFGESVYEDFIGEWRSLLSNYFESKDGRLFG